MLIKAYVLVNLILLFFSQSVLSSQMVEPERIPVKIELTEEDLQGLTEIQKQDAYAVVEILQKSLYTWAKLDIELPPTVFEDRTQIIAIDSNIDSIEDSEVAKIGYNRNRLNPVQISQLKEEAIFKVPSLEDPKRFHVWKVHWMFVVGKKEISVRFNRRKTGAINSIFVSIPDRFVGNNFMSLRRGVTNMYNGVREIIDLLIGLPRYKFKYSEESIDEIINKNRKLHAKENQESVRDQRVFDTELMGNAKKVLKLIYRSFDNAWSKRLELENRTQIIKEEIANGREGEELYIEVNRRLSLIIQNLLQEKILKSEKLEALSPGLAQLLVNQGKALGIVFSAEQEFTNEMLSKRDEITNNLRDQHPWRSLRKEWLEPKVQAAIDKYYQDNVWGMYSETIEKVRDAGLIAEAAALEEDIYFLKTKGKEIYRSLSREQVPADQVHYTVPILRKSRWSVKQTESGRYFLIKDRSIEANTGSTGWRLVVNYWHRMRRNWYVGIDYAMLTNLWNGPIGLKSLFLKQPFAYKWTVDPSTGAITKDTEDLRSTLVSRVKALRKAGNDLIADHEKSGDYGLFGKKMERALLFLKADLGLKIVAPATTALAQGLATCMNAVASCGVVGTSMIWAPLTGLIQHGFDFAAYDTLGTNQRSPSFTTNSRWARMIFNQGFHRIFPAVQSGAKTTIGFAQSVGASALGTIYHPLVGAGEMSLGAADKVIRSSVDNVWLKVLEKFGYIPAQNYWAVHRISGPGVEESYFYKIQPSVALSGFLARLEYMELNFVSDRIKALITQPKRDLETALAPFERVIGSVRNDKLTPLTRRVTEKEQSWLKELDEKLQLRMDDYDSLMFIQPEARGAIKLSKEDLLLVEKQASVLIQEFLKEKMFSKMSEAEVQEFWESKKITPNNWPDLVRKILSDIFYNTVLTPLEESNGGVVIDVRQPDVVSLIDDLLHAKVETSVGEASYVNYVIGKSRSYKREEEPRNVLIGGSCDDVLFSKVKL
ncbi:MAG: hypothetical protein H6625_03455 [Bdellovibrionaceae bacterium]|nr:hypothetical protein [Pseudobdellovibrionaceae bacterium]